jgi:hypothetical protein
MNIKYRYNRIAVRLRRIVGSFKSTIEQKNKLDKVQLSAFNICKKMICNPESELIYAPMSRTYYIEHAHYYIRMSENAISITNGKFSYYVWMPFTQISELKLIFDRVSQSKSHRLEKKYTETTLENLNEILTSLKSY